MTFSYDANGSLLQVGNKTISWTSYRYPEQITNPDNGTVTSFGYGPDRQRYRETIITNGTDVRRVDVLGTLYERIEEHGTITHKHYIKAGSKVVAVHDRRMDNDGSNATGRLVYLHRDHLGSVDTVTTAAGSAMTRMSYSAYGERRDPTDWDSDIGDAELAANRDITTRGYTGHQMLDDSGFIHMGGRVYDPFTGRFLSADPNIPDPSDSRSFDRYAYVYNNPLSYTDPSGFVASRQMIHGDAYHQSPITLGMAAMFGSVGESVTGNGSFGLFEQRVIRVFGSVGNYLTALAAKKLSEVSAGVRRSIDGPTSGAYYAHVNHNGGGPGTARQMVEEEVDELMQGWSEFMEDIGLSDYERKPIEADTIVYGSIGTDGEVILNFDLGVDQEARTTGRLHKCCELESIDKSYEILPLASEITYDGNTPGIENIGRLRIIEKFNYSSPPSCPSTCRPINISTEKIDSHRFLDWYKQYAQ